jgi:hypothetical protein
MRRRPIVVTVISIVLVIAGAAGLIYHGRELWDSSVPWYETVTIALVRVLAIVAGVFMLRGRNWARWLAVLWMAFHAVLSIFHSRLRPPDTSSR